MGGGDGGIVALRTVERDLVPAVLKTLDKFSKTYGKYRKHDDRRVAGRRGWKDLPGRRESARAKYRPQLAGLLGNIHLNSRRIEQLAAQHRDFERRLAQGDIAAVSAESRMPPKELRRIAAAVGDGRQRAERAVDDFMNAQALAGTWQYYRVGDYYLDTFEVGKAALLDALDEFRYWRGPMAAVHARHHVRKAVAHCIVDALLLVDAPRGEELRDERILGRYPGIDDSAVLKPGNLKTRMRITSIAAKCRRMRGGRNGVGTKPANIADGDFAEEIVAGRLQMRVVLRESPLTWEAVARWRDCLVQGTMRMSDIIDVRATRIAYRPVSGGQDNEGGDV